MSNFNTMDIASGIGGKIIAKSDVMSALESYEKYQALKETNEDRKDDCVEMTDRYYSLTTSFYEYGWGKSFHFANRFEGETLRESIKRYEHFIALQLGLKPGHKVLDAGCGIGGPLREIAQFSKASITGITINQYQITRGEELNRAAGLDKTCNFVKGNFMDMPFSDNSFDAAYAIEATCHAPDAYGCYKEIFRVLKPGQCFAVYEWCMTDAFDPDNAEHRQIKSNIEIGAGIQDLRLTTKCHEALRQAGFDVICEKDVAKDSPVPWYLPLSPSDFRATPFAKSIFRFMVKSLECIGIAPKGSRRIVDLLEKQTDGLLEGGRKEIFTPMYFFLARKPEWEN